jgi:hypothetical protein
MLRLLPQYRRLVRQHAAELIAEHGSGASMTARHLKHLARVHGYRRVEAFCSRVAVEIARGDDRKIGISGTDDGLGSVACYPSNRPFLTRSSGRGGE